MAMELGTQQLAETIEKEKNESKKRVKTLESDVEEAMKKDKKEILGKLESTADDMKKKIELETNELR